MKLNLGVWVANSQPVELDLDTLLRSNLLIQGASGSGKSWAFRRLLEQAAPHVPIAVIDPEGEFASLRERFDFVLAGPDGDTPVDLRSAGLLARKVLELRTSIICDLSELSPLLRPQWVHDFLDELTNAPKRLWTDFLIAIDEAHEFAPEPDGKSGRGSAVSLSSVIDIAAKGRKRGYGLVLATQRVSKLSKNAAAECKNKIVGQAVLSTDLDRAAGDLGISRQGRAAFDAAIKVIEPGNFWALGRAITKEPMQMRFGRVTTSHPEPGRRKNTKPVPPTKKILHLLPQLADLPQEAETKAQTEEDLRKEIAALKLQLSTAPAAEPETVIERVEVPVIPQEVRQAVKEVRTAMERPNDMRQALNEMSMALDRLDEALRTTDSAPEPHVARVERREPPPAPRTITRVTPRHDESNGRASTLGRGERSILIAVAQHRGGVSREQLTVLTGFKRSTRDAYIQRLRAAGYVDLVGLKIAVTEAGVAALGRDYKPLPTGSALRAHWMQRLPEGERRILEIVSASYPQPVDREKLSTATGYARSSRDAYIQRLSARKLVDAVGRGAVLASGTLFDRSGRA